MKRYKVTIIETKETTYEMSGENRADVEDTIKRITNTQYGKYDESNVVLDRQYKIVPIDEEEGEEE